jgi:hypothetical protein
VPDTAFAYEPYGNASTSPPWVIQYDSVTKSILESQDGGANFTPITAPEVSITSIKFYVIGSSRGSTGDTTQPKVIIVIDGVAAPDNIKARTTFHVQATAVQRLLDI